MICKQLADYSPVFYRPADGTQGDRDTVIAATLTSLAVPFTSLPSCCGWLVGWLVGWFDCAVNMIQIGRA
jgi:hypothetical protein